MTIHPRSTPAMLWASLVAAAVLGNVTPARAQTEGTPRSTCGAGPSSSLLSGTFQGFRQLASRESIGILALGAVAAFGAHSVDTQVTRDFSSQPLTDSLRSGAIIGGTPFELGGSMATYMVGRALHKPCVVSLGADLVHAELMAEGLTIAIKEVTRRSRPEGSGFAFPSGHTTVTFATATVLQQHLGWKVGIPAYAVATYVAASRVEMRKHHLSDVAFGAALGIVAGRTVSMGHGRRLMVSPIAGPDAAGASFTWLGRK